MFKYPQLSVSKMTFFNGLFFQVNIHTWSTHCIWLMGPLNLHLQPFPSSPKVENSTSALLFCIAFIQSSNILCIYSFCKEITCTPPLKCQITEVQGFLNCWPLFSPSLALSTCSINRISELIAGPLPGHFTQGIYALEHKKWDMNFCYHLLEVVEHCGKEHRLWNKMPVFKSWVCHFLALYLWKSYSFVFWFPYW